MLIYKITTGFVTQTFDTEKKKFVSQEFTAGDECVYETEHENENGEFTDENGEVWDSPSLLMGTPEPYLPYHMVQPEDG
tara:strand:+ start:2946 stop:3182 length:237 start_codon:yes stop_codon:yes gene_type:complete